MIFMRKSAFCILIQMIKFTSSFVCHLPSIMNRLSTAAYTSSGTSHDFYEVVMYFPFVNTVQKCPCIAQTTNCSRSDSYIVNLEIRLLDSLILIESCTSYRFKCIFRRILTLKQIVCRTKSCLHDTSCCTKNYTCSCSILHRPVTFYI